MLDKNHDTVAVEDALVSPTHHALDKHGWRSFITGVFHKLAKQTLLFCIFIFLCALGLNLYRLGTPSIWFDEALSISRAQQPLYLLYQIVARSQPNMTLYYFFLHFWLSFMAFWGLPPNEFVVRLPSAIFAAGGSVMVFLLGRRFLGLSAGFTAAILYLLNDLQLVYTQDARAYSMQLLLLCVSWYAFFAIVTAERPRTRWWICYVVVAALSVYAQLFSFFVLLAQFSMFALLLILPGPWQETLRKQGRTLIISALSFFILVIPMLLASRVGAKTGWLPIPRLYDIYYFFLTISEGGKPALLLNLLCILGSLSLGLLLYLPGSKHLLERLSQRLPGKANPITKVQITWAIVIALVLWIITPVVISYIVSQKSVHVFSSRYLVVILPAFFLLIGLGVALIRQPIVRVLLTLCLFLIALQHVPAYYASAQVENWRPATHWLEQRYQQNDGMVCYDNSEGCQVVMGYYLRLDTNGDIDFASDSPGAFHGIDYDITNHTPGTYRAAVDPQALQVYGTKHPRVFFITARIAAKDAQLSAAHQWLNTHYTLIEQVVTHTVTIRLYLTNMT